MNSYAGAVLDQLDRLFNRGTIAGLGEGSLLERYVADRDEAAFAALVARHGPMVLGVCRRVLRDERDVEDAFQATFLVLVRRAGVIRDGELVGRWLHGVARRVALRARAHSARRFIHEQPTYPPVEPAAADVGLDAIERRELASIVDEEVTQLPSSLRAPVVLCYLEGLSHDEAARRLHWPIGTVRSRMARAREILRHRLARRGVMADCTAIVASLARPPVPPEWLDATVRSSLKFATHSATAAATIVSTRSVAIARRVLQTMLITKLSYIGAAGLGIVLAFGGVRTLAFQAPGEARSVRSASAAAQKSGDQGVAQVPPTPASPSSDDRNRQLASSVLAIGDDLDRAMRQLAELQDRLRKLEAELAPVRPGRPAPAPAAPRPTAAPAREDNKPEDSDKPYYVNLGRLILVISPDGSWAGRYDIQAGKPQPLNLPALRGDRREFIVMSDDMSKNPHPLGRNRISGVAMESVNHPWFLALDLDGGRKVTRITAFHAIDGTWIDQEITEPVARSAVRMFPGGVLVLGRRIYALSIPAKRWGILESPPGTETIPSYQGHAYWAERRGRLFRFNPATGSWDDIYARALQAEGKFDTGFAPAQ